MKKSIPRQAFHYLGLAVIGGNLFLIALVAVWLLQPVVVPSVQTPIKIDNPNNEIAAGEAIMLEVTVDKPENSAQLARTSVQAVCESGIILPFVGNTRDLPPGQVTVTNSNYVLPSKTLVGDRCEFVFRNEYRINPLKTVVREWRSEKFTVVERQENGLPHRNQAR